MSPGRLRAALVSGMLGMAPGLAAPQAPDPPARIQLAQAQPADLSRQLAAAVARLGALEEEVRRLRGRLEELEYGQQSGGRAAAGASPTAPVTQSGTSAQPPRTTPGSLTLGAVREGREPGSDTAAPETQAALEPIRLDPNAPARQQYDAGLQLLQRGDFTTAQQAFDTLLRRYPNDQLAPNAAYWLGETYYIRKDYSGAASIFARNYRTYGADAAKAPDNLLKLGMSLAALGDRDRACQTFAELARRHKDASAPVQQTLVREQAAAGCS